MLSMGLMTLDSISSSYVIVDKCWKDDYGNVIGFACFVAPFLSGGVCSGGVSIWSTRWRSFYAGSRRLSRMEGWYLSWHGLFSIRTNPTGIAPMKLTSVLAALTSIDWTFPCPFTLPAEMSSRQEPTTSLSFCDQLFFFLHRELLKSITNLFYF